MAQLWIEDPACRPTGWAVLPLDAQVPLRVDTSPPQRLLSGTVPLAQAILVPAPAGGGTWVLLAGLESRVRVNGLLVCGIRVLRDRDEVRVVGAAGTLFFSVESPARIEPFDGGGGKHSVCPRCQQPIAVRSPSVRCPGCRVVHHATDDLPCWRYTAGCAICGYPTAGFRWTPEEPVR